MVGEEESLRQIDNARRMGVPVDICPECKDVVVTNLPVQHAIDLFYEGEMVTDDELLAFFCSEKCVHVFGRRKLKSDRMFSYIYTRDTPDQ